MSNQILKGKERIILTEDQKVRLFELGKLRWDAKEIAGMMDWPIDVLQQEMADPESEISRLLLKGELSAQFEVESRLYKDAKSGDPDAILQFEKVMRDRSFRMTRLDLFGGAADVNVFEAIQRYYKDGACGDLSAKEQTYLEILQMIYSFEVHYGKRESIRILTKAPYSLSYERAADLVSEALEMFNGGRRVSKDAMRAHIADSYDTLYHAMIKSASTTKDYAMAASILEKKAKLLRLDQPDDIPIDTTQYRKDVRLLSLTPESIGLPAANRDELAAQIDSLGNVSEQEKQRLRMEANIIDTDIIKILQNVTQEES